MEIITSRRSFLASAFAFSLAGCKSGGLGFFSGIPRIKLGVVSDIHITTWESTAAFRNTLRYFNQCGVDAVVIAGDMADHGLLPQLENVARAWFEVFPDDRGADGRHVERVFVTGNHDPEGLNYRDRFMDAAFAEHHLSYDEAKKLTLTNVGLARSWQQCFHEDYQPIFAKNVKGFDFVGAHWDTRKGVSGIERWFTDNAAKINTSQSFFYIQHQHPCDTVYGKEAWGHDEGQSVRALSAYANAIAFSGHSHTSLTDERSVWRGAFTSIGTSSLSYVCLPAHRENGWELGRIARENLNNDKAVRQGQVLSVYDDHITIVRRDFVRNEDIDTAWCLELPSRADPFSARAARAVVPEFPRGGKPVVRRSQDELNVSFPSAHATSGRPYEYEITVARRSAETESVVCQKRFFSPAAALPRSSEDKLDTMSFAIKMSDIVGAGEFLVKVRPLDSYGVGGKDISTDWISFEKQEV